MLQVLAFYSFFQDNLRGWLKSVTVSARVLGTNIVLSLLGEPVHTGNTEKRNVSL